MTMEEKAYKVIAALDLVKIVPAVAGRASAIEATKREEVGENITPGDVLNLLRKSYRVKQVEPIYAKFEIRPLAALKKSVICKERYRAFLSAS